MRSTLFSALAAAVLLLNPASAAADVAPELSLSAQTVDFGTIFSGTSIVRTLTVTNTGTEPVVMGPLGATPEANFDAYYQFGNDQGGFTLPPGYAHAIVILFSASGSGSVEGMLTITSSVPQKSVRLTARSVHPPEMTVSPDTLDTELDAGSQTERTLTITNNGESDLEFRIAALPTSGAVSGPVGKHAPFVAGLELTYPHVYPLPIAHKQAEEIGTLASEITSTVAGPGMLFGVIEYRYIAELDVNTGEMIDTFAVIEYSDGSEGLAFDGKYLYYNGYDDGITATILRIDVSTQVIDTARFAISYIDALAHSGSMLYALASSQGIIYEINFDSESIVGQIAPATGWLHGGLTFGGLRQTLFVTSPGTNYIYELDPITGEILNSIYSVVIGQTFGLAYSNALEALILGTHNGQYYVLDPDDGSIRREFMGRATYALAGDETGIPPFVSVNPKEGVVAAGSSVDITVAFNASELFAGAYTAQLRIYTNEPEPQPARRVGASLLVHGSAALTLSDSLHFASTFVGASSTLELQLKNSGSEMLVVNRLAVVGDAFTIHPTDTLRIAPRESETVFVRFEPTAPGMTTGTLTVSSNAGETVVQLSGEASDPPVVFVQPDSIWASLHHGQQTTGTIVIKNAGGSVLEWESVAVYAEGGTVLRQSPAFSRGAPAPKLKAPSATRSAPSGELYAMAATASSVDGDALHPAPLSAILENLNDDMQSVSSIIPNRFEFSEGEAGQEISDGGNDMYDGGNVLSTNLATFIPYTGGVITNSPAFGGSGDNYFTQKAPGLFVLVADLDGVSWFEVSGNLGADGAGIVDGSILQTRVAGTDYQIFLKRVYNAGDPSVNHLFIVQSGAGAEQEFSTLTDEDYHRVFHLEQTDRVYYLLYAANEGGYIDNDAALNIANAFLNAAGPSPSWIALEPSFGSIEPGDSASVTVTLNAEEVVEGQYRADVLTYGNGLDSTAVRTPVMMDVMLNVAVEDGDIPAEFELEGSFPNPAGRNGATITYALPKAAAVRLTVYDVAGRRVATLIDEQQSARRHEVHFDTSALPSGMYVYVLDAGDFRTSRSLLVLR